MKYNVGDKVRIKNIDWYNENKGNADKTNSIWCEDGGAWFFYHMSQYCGKIMTIKNVWSHSYTLEGSDSRWTDEMIECKVEEEIKPIDFTIRATNTKGKVEVVIPDGYDYEIENDKLYFITKKTEVTYPKTYEECENILGLEDSIIEGCLGYEYKLLNAFQKLLMCRDAYWKIAGEEMGLDKPWSPNDSDYITGRYCIFVHRGNIICDTPAQDCVLTFPTAEMRDAFKENFGPDIEICEELL